MQATLSFRTGNEFAEQTRTLATVLGLKSSDYIRAAVREKNERVMGEHIAMLSRKLADKHRALNTALEGTLTDGLN